MVTSILDPKQFKKIALRNTILPLFVGMILSAVFSFLIVQLMSVIQLVDHTNQVIAKIHLVSQLAVDGQTALRGYVITQNPAFMEPYKRARATILEELEELERLTDDNATQGARIRRIKRTYDSWYEYAQDVLAHDTQDKMILRVKQQDGRSIMEEIRNTLTDMVKTEELLLHERNEDAQKSVTLALTLVVIGSISTGIFLAYYSRKQLTVVTDSYSGALTQSSNQNEILQRQGWLKTLQVELSNQIRGEQNISRISSEILGVVCRTMHAKAGAIYILENGRTLNMAASFAMSASEIERSQSFNIGETLVGQVARDKKQKLLNPAPEGYLKISSAMGEMTPVAILVHPIIVNDEVKAVIEVAIPRQFTDQDQEVVSILSEGIGYAITAAQYNIRLQELLEETRRNAEELQAQQEELRVSNEELEQQTKALKESHIKMENQQAELEQSNQQLEEQTQILENQKIILDEKNRELIISQAALEDKSREVARTSQYKSEFLANMSHELRTPLNSTLILAKLLSDNKPGNLTQEQIKYAEIIHTSGNDLLNLINDILDLSKVEAGKMNVNPEVVDLDSLKKNLEALFKAQAENKNLDFKVEMDSSAPASIITDRMRLEQILKNFLSNAIKFTDKGFVQLQMYREPKGISFAISDSGIGIPQEQQAVIFEAFRQADGTSNRKYGGTGLGLSISRELSHLLGGDITVKSASGQGSTFVLTIPAEYKEPAEKKEVHSHAIPQPAPKAEVQEPVKELTFSFQDDREKITKSSRKILIIEDDESFAQILFELAHEMKFGALVAPTAEEGLKLAQLYVPHAVLLDMRLPDHSGMLVLDQLKMNSKTRHIPVHVISSSDFSRSALEMGAIGYMLKPVKREQLQVAFSNLSSIMGQKEKSVLVVEDDQVQRDHIVSLISDDFVNVDAVEKAQDALSKLAEKTYDCMIMDLSLPDLSGYDLLAKLSNESHNYSYPPVIVYTARDLTREEEEKLRQYSGSIIIKGAKSPERLLSEVTLFLHRVETELPIERQKMLKDLRNREKTLEERKILVVDDDVRNIYALTSALENYGAEVIVARNGREAIEKVMTTEKLDMVLMDIMMPEMDGYEAMRKLRMNKKFEKLPIIALTAKAMKDDQEKCLEAGANDYLPKPLNVDKLLSLIRVWLPNQRSFLT